MANPRQRRKMRSGSHKPVHHSRRAKKVLKKQPAIQGPKVLQEAWDNHKTVRQNYEALGLASSLTPMASGGVERALGVEDRATPDAMEVECAPERSSSNAAGPTLRKGFGRIVRDANGNVVDVQLPEDDSADAAPGDRLIEDIPDPSKQEGLAAWVNLGTSIVPRNGSASHPSRTHVVESLEDVSKTRGGTIPRFPSSGELGVLRKLVEKYGEDVEAMARDRKLNVDQRTAGQLTRSVKKAGGFAQLRNRT